MVFRLLESNWEIGACDVALKDEYTLHGDDVDDVDGVDDVDDVDDERGAGIPSDGAGVRDAASVDWETKEGCE